MYIGVPQGGKKSWRRLGYRDPVPFSSKTLFFFSSSFFPFPSSEKLVFFGGGVTLASVNI